jgi:prophage antirepressor-like protein
MDIVKAFISNEETSNINIIGTYDEPLFQANQIGKLLGIVTIRTTISDFESDEKVVHTMATGGGPQDVLFLTEVGLYRLLGMSRKPIARKFQKWVATVVKEIRLNGKYELECQIKDVIEKSLNDNDIFRHKNILKSFDDKPGVYIGKIKILENNKMIIKIGSSHALDKRSSDLKKFFGNFNLIDFFPANRYRALERSIHNDPNFNKYKYVEEINGNTSTETYCVTNEIYSELVSIINRKQKDYQGMSEEHLFEIEKQKKELEILEKKKEVELLALQKLQMQNNIPITIIKEIPLKYNINENLVIKGNKIQKYTIEGELIITYNTLCNAARKEVNVSESGIRKAINNKTIYKDHRWLHLDRELPDDTIQNLGETKIIKIMNLGLIAMLDINKEYIIHVFKNQSDAATSRHLKSTMCIYNSIKNDTLCSGHYFYLWNKCNEEIKQKYLENNTLPETDRRHNAIKVNQIHPITNEIVKVFLSYTDIMHDFQVSLRKIKQVMNNNEIYKGYKWELVAN